MPFIARYRKEATGGLDDIQLRELEERLRYLRELEERRAAILKSIDEQGKLTPELRRAIDGARDQGGAGRPLPAVQAQAPHQGPDRARSGPRAAGRRAARRPDARSREHEAAAFVDADKGVADAKRGARRRARHPDRALGRGRRAGRRAARMAVEPRAALNSKLADGKDENRGAKFCDYFDYDEPIGAAVAPRARRVPRRARGDPRRRLGADEEPEAEQPALGRGPIARAPRRRRPAAGRRTHGCRTSSRWTWRVKLSLHLERRPVRRACAKQAEKEAIKVFAEQPARPAAGRARRAARRRWASIPGIRTGVKVAVVDAHRQGASTTATIYPHEPRERLGRVARASLAALCAHAQRRPDRHRQRHGAPRDRQARRRPDRAACPQLKLTKVVVVAKPAPRSIRPREFAAKELPDARRQRCAARSRSRGACRTRWPSWSRSTRSRIGVGQYQHDVNQSELPRTLDAVVEDCVNAVGVDLNTASAPLLARVSGLGERWPATSCATATRNGAFRAAQAAAEGAAAWAPRPSSRRRLPAHPRRRRPARRAPACIRRPIRWCDASSRRPKADMRGADRRRTRAAQASSPSSSPTRSSACPP